MTWQMPLRGIGLFMSYLDIFYKNPFLREKSIGKLSGDVNHYRI